MSNSQQPVIFLSHHSSKVELAEHLARYLSKNGLEAWYAPKNIHAGEQWDESITKAIENCKALVLLFCTKADSSIQVKRELTLADKYSKPVFWLRVERVLPENLSYYLSSTQWLDWMDTRDDTLEQLIRDIHALEEGNSAVILEKPSAKSGNATSPSSLENTWAKGIFAFNSDRDAAECAANVYFGMAYERPDSSVILPTGRSAALLFRAMVRLARNYTECPFGEAQIISDTETFGVWSGHETSRTRHVMDALIEPLERIGKAPVEDQLHLLSGVYMKDDPIKDAQRLIRNYPPSVHAVSVSPIGEILAYEVGTYQDMHEILYDAPRILEVGEHSKKYIDPNQPSKSIISVGLGTALSSEVLLILAFDVQKSNILRRLLLGPMTAGIPATLLRNHTNAFILTTERAAIDAGINHLVLENKNPKEAAKWIISQ